ncbi:hypothetical protein MK280_05480, partial [Myxococcota bacterium]|nr:hypothetical protein [Myxococcota bacterium]
MVLELGNLYIRFWKNGSQVLTGGGAPYEIATTYTAAQLVEIDWAQNASTFILTHPSHPVRKLQRVADNNWTYEQLEFKYGPYLGRGQVAPGVVATATSLNVDTPLWLVSEQNPSSPPISNQLDFRRGNPDDVLFTAREGPDSTNAVVANVFDYDRDVGRKILLNAYNLNGHHNSTGSQKALGELADSELAFPVYGTIADVENEAAAGVSVGAGNKGDTIAINFYDGISAPDRLTNEGAGNTWISTQMWFLSPFYGATENPATCTFFEERLWLGRTALAPELFYGSRTGTIDDFDILSAADSPPQLLETQVGSGALRIQPPNPQSEVIATSALSLGVSGNEISEIQWMRPLQSSLLVATSRAIYQISSATNDGAFGPTNGVSVKVTNAIGSTLKGLATIRDKLAFMLPAADRLYQMGFELSADSFTASDMSLFNPDIFAQGLQYASISEDHEPIYWAVTTEDKLIAMTVDDRQRVFGAHEH